MTDDRGAWWPEAIDQVLDMTEDRVVALRRIDGDLIIEYANRAAAKALGAGEPAATVGTSARKYYPPAYIDEVLARLDHMGDELTYESVREMPAGRRVVRVRIRRVSHELFIGTTRDVSEELEARDRLDELEALANVGTYSWDLVSNRGIWSLQLYRIFGWDPDAVDDIRPADVLEAIHPEDRAYASAIAGAIDGDEQPTGNDYRIVRPDGGVRHVQTRSRRIRDAEGRLVRLVGTVQDVTEQRELEARQRAAEQATVDRQRALELNDDVVQGLARAWLALHLGDVDEAMTAISAATTGAREIVAELLERTAAVRDDGSLQPGDLVRERPAGAARP